MIDFFLGLSIVAGQICRLKLQHSLLLCPHWTLRHVLWWILHLTQPLDESDCHHMPQKEAAVVDKSHAGLTHVSDPFSLSCLLPLSVVISERADRHFAVAVSRVVIWRLVFSEENVKEEKSKLLPPDWSAFVDCSFRSLDLSWSLRIWLGGFLLKYWP